jgi:serine/threonine-protein phosphatase 2A regulatory subunit B''
MMKSNWAEKLK